MKTIDITEKLNFEEKPQLKIKDTVLTVNNEASAMLEIIQKSENMKAQDIKSVCDVIFDDLERKKLESLHLNLTDYMTVIQSAVELVAGGISGEVQTRTTT